MWARYKYINSKINFRYYIYLGKDPKIPFRVTEIATVIQYYQNKVSIGKLGLLMDLSIGLYIQIWVTSEPGSLQETHNCLFVLNQFEFYF